MARGSPSLMPVSGALWSPLSAAAAGWPFRPPRAHVPVGVAPPAAGAAIACLGRQLAGASAAGGGRAAWHCRMPALPLSATPRGATMRPARARSNRTTRRWSTPGLGRHHFSEPASPRARGEGRQSTKDVSVQFRIILSDLRSMHGNIWYRISCTRSYCWWSRRTWVCSWRGWPHNLRPCNKSSTFTSIQSMYPDGRIPVR